MKHFAIAVLLLVSLRAAAQTTTCPAPTPGSPHVCLKWVLSTTTGVAYNVYRATTAGAENYGSPLNASPLAAGTTAYYDASVVIGTTYFYTILAVGTGGVLSAPSNEVSAQIPVPPSSPTTPSAIID
jgi:fibronectin type 3 domain-containing protein